MDLIDLDPFAQAIPRRDTAHDALARLGRLLGEAGYRFVTPTPETIRRVNSRPGNEEAHDLAGIFGWSRPFRPGILPRVMLDCLTEADRLEQRGSMLRSKVRFSRLGSSLYLHSAWPTESADAVFFGPDTYRFARLIETEIADLPARRIADVGCGSGAGGLHLWSLLGCPDDVELVLADINPAALEAAAVNADLAGCDGAVLHLGDLLAGQPGRFDLIVGNPPYLVDLAERTYRHGGGALGWDLSLRIVRECVPRLAPGGRLVLYTGAAIVGGRDGFRTACSGLLDAQGLDWRYEEIDPDVFGEELVAAPYDRADRIAAVALIIDAGAKGARG